MLVIVSHYLNDDFWGPQTAHLGGDAARHRVAPPKTYERMFNKSQSDYSARPAPTAMYATFACIDANTCRGVCMWRGGGLLTLSFTSVLDCARVGGTDASHRYNKDPIRKSILSHTADQQAAVFNDILARGPEILAVKNTFAMDDAEAERETQGMMQVS